MRTAFAAVLAAAVLGGSGCDSKPAPVESFKRGELAKLEILKPPVAQPRAAFNDQAGKERTLADFKGKVVVVNFWATWCAPCKQEMPTLANLANANSGRPVEVVTISLDKLENADLAQATLADLSKGALDFYQAKNFDIAWEANVDFFPTTIIYAKDGRELARLVGDAKWDGAEAKGLIKSALAQ
jgi:thiol-disulfide isomerase/thioredoxin